MKLFSVIAALVFSSAVMAKTPATEAFKNLIPAGKHEGLNGTQKCFVEVDYANDAVTVSIISKGQADAFTVLNKSLSYSVNETTGEVSATMPLNFPHYLKGGTKILNVKENDLYQVEFYISNILLDHRGNDASTYSACRVQQ